MHTVKSHPYPFYSSGKKIRESLCGLQLLSKSHQIPVQPTVHRARNIRIELARHIRCALPPCFFSFAKQASTSRL